MKAPLVFLAVALCSPIAAAQNPSLHNSTPPQESAKSPDKNQNPPAAPDYSKEPFIVESISATVVFANDGTSSAESTIRIHIQSQAALQQFGILALPYASAISTMEVVYVRVTKPDHRVVETPAENSVEMPTEITRKAPFYSDQKEKQVAVKGLEIGDTLEYQYRSEVKTPLDPGQFWFSYNFLRGAIVLNDMLEISVPRDHYVQVLSPKNQPTIADKGALKVYTWKTANLKPKSDDAAELTDPNEPDHASVELTTFRSWDEIGQWFRGLATPRSAVTPEIQQKANELTRDAKSESEKIEAIYHFVSTNFRYIGIALGIGRYQPHSAAEVLTNDYGDCKDKHTLFAALLAAVGVKAYPALISSGAKIDPNFPTLFQLDHVITALPRDKGFLFLDTTPEVAPFGFLVATLRDKHAVVLLNDAPAQLVKTPPDPPFASFFNFQVDATLDDAGTLESKMQITARGDSELLYRYAFRAAGQPQWKDVMQRISSNLNFGGTVSDVSLSPLDITNQPLHVEYNYHRKEFGDWKTRRIVIPCPPAFLPTVPADYDAAKHPKPIEIGTPFTLHYQGTVKLPANSRPHLLPSLDLHETFADYHADYSFSDGTLHFERSLAVKSREITPAQVAAYRKFITALEDDYTTFITLRPEDYASAETSGSSEAQEFYSRGAEAWRRHDTTEAARLYQLALDKDPKFAGPMYWLGAAHVAMGQTERGIEEMTKSLSLDPSQRENYQYVCSLLSSHHRDQEALELWKQLRRNYPDDALAPDNIVRILFLQKRYAEAIPELEAAAEKYPDVPRIRLQLGQAFVYSGDPKKAAAAFDKAFELDSSGATLNLVAYTLADNEFQLDDALKYAQKAVADLEARTADLSLDELLPGDVSTASDLSAYWDTLGWVYFRLSHFDLAEKYLNAAWLLSQDPVIADHLGQTYEKLSRKRDAAIAYKRAIAAGHAPLETQARLDALQKGVKFKPGDEAGWKDLQELRTYKLGRLATKHTSAEFYVLMKPTAKPPDVEFISGSDEMRSAAKSIAGLKFNVLFPESSETQILLRGVIDCEPELPGCLFVLIPPSSTKYTKLPRK